MRHPVGVMLLVNSTMSADGVLMHTIFRTISRFG